MCVKKEFSRTNRARDKFAARSQEESANNIETNDLKSEDPVVRPDLRAAGGGAGAGVAAVDVALPTGSDCGGEVLGATGGGAGVVLDRRSRDSTGIMWLHGSTKLGYAVA